MRLFKCQRSPDVCWPLNDRNTESDASTNSETDPVDHSCSMVLDLGSAKKAVRL